MNDWYRLKDVPSNLPQVLAKCSIGLEVRWKVSGRITDMPDARCRLEKTCENRKESFCVLNAHTVGKAE